MYIRYTKVKHIKMRLKQDIITNLKANRLFRLKIAIELDFTEVWIDRLITANKENGPLTTAKSLQAIREELKLTDSDILEEEN